MKNTLFLVITAFIAVSCISSQKEVTKLDDMFHHTDSMTHQKCDTKDYIWGHPSAMRYLHSMIFVFDEKADNLFHLIDCRETDSIIHFGVKGQGVNEFITPFDFQVMGDTALSVFDLAKRELFLLSPSQIKRGVEVYPSLFKDTIPNVIKVLATKFHSFVSLGFYEECMFKYRGRDIDSVQNIGHYPYKDAGEQAVNGIVRAMAYQGTLNINPSNDKFVYAVNSADILYFYEINPQHVKQVRKYEFNHPEYTPMGEKGGWSAAISADNKMTFMASATTDKYVYLLYSGKSIREADLKVFSGNVIYVFDWLGNAIKKIVLDVPIEEFCVNGDDSEIYAFSNLPEPTLIKFAL